MQKHGARRKDPEAKKVFEEIKAAEGMFLEAVAESGFVYRDGKIIGAREDEDGETQKSKKGANRPIKEQDLELYLKTGKTKHTRDKKEGMMKQGKKPILTSVSEIQDFLSNVIHGKAGGEVRAFGFVGERLAKEVKKKRGSLDIQDHFLEIVADDLREAYIRHHQPKEKGDIALSEQDFLHIPQFLNDFDGIIDIVTHKNRTQIHIYKETEDGFIKILTVVSGERNALQVTKLTGSSKEKFLKKYKKTGRDTGSPGSSSFDEENSNFATRTRHTAGVLPNDSIHDSEPIVNPSDEISSGKSSEPVKKSRKANPQTSGKAVAKDPEVEHLKGMQRQTVARYARAKVYTKTEALENIEQAARMLDETYGFDGGLGEASGFVKLTKGKGSTTLDTELLGTDRHNRVCFTTEDGSVLPADLTIMLSVTLHDSGIVRYEAEKAKLTGSAYSPGTHVAGIDDVGSSLTFDALVIGEDGDYTLRFYYAAPMGLATHTVYVDGVKRGTIKYNEKGGNSLSWGSFSEDIYADIHLTLTKGTHTLRIEKTASDVGFAELDAFDRIPCALTGGTPVPPPEA